MARHSHRGGAAAPLVALAALLLASSCTAGHVLLQQQQEQDAGEGWEAAGVLRLQRRCGTRGSGACSCASAPSSLTRTCLPASLQT